MSLVFQEATDRLKRLPIFHGATGGFHTRLGGSEQKVDYALLDCLPLSRCRFVVQCASALSAFAKVLNPSLEICRVAASEMFTDIPYFSLAYIPVLESTDALCQQILKKQMADAWRVGPEALKKFGKPFNTVPRVLIPDLR